MMSCGYITVAEGTWGSSRLSAKLLMSMMVMIVMMSPYTSASIEMTNLSPADGFTIGEGKTMNIVCSYYTNNLVWFRLMRNSTSVVEMQYNQSFGVFETKMYEKDFSCTFMRYSSNSGVFKCWKKNLNCKDVGLYSCWLRDGDISSIKFLKVKSSIKSLALAENDFQMSRTATFKCTANVALPFPGVVVFQWRLTNGRNEIVKEDRLNVWHSNKCYGEVTSFYRYNVQYDDFTHRSAVSCTVFNQTHTEIIDPPIIIASSAPAGILYSKWILVVNLILLLVAVAISR
ncbi:uncharacterized protein LOC106878948 [Octopus bimaculoides]|uniref:uncharacterized protein LOC106878948 n=1 Tax=Octopus bimaculoides TaxID=37653 RepID=UPI00071C46A8|nr:uncharacterized protein LOC106878948 [Octopus bimaculoides]|eukprot:XP_014783809.1 PREDICTED: uncharacterized protein LOC106878948 [Octopus bimaculoides]